ncbi:MAG: type VI secretion system-associated FHA domain protein TagH [Casimicrobium sp.]
MPDIILKVVTVDAAQPAQAFARSFDASGGTIGRDDTNALALPDKHRRVSRLHATISFPAGVPTITNSSSSLPISVGEQQLDFGESMPIHHGVLIEVGPYILQAHSLSFDATPAAAEASAPGYTGPMSGVAAVRTHTGMTVVLPPPTAAPAPVMSPVAATYVPPTVQPLATPLPAAFSGMSDLSDLLGGGPVLPVAPPAYLVTPPPPPNAAPTPEPFYAAPASYVATPPAYIPPAPDNHDPFADLLDGIGGPPASATATNLSGYGSVHQVAPMPQTPSGLSTDPLAALGGAAGGSFGGSPGASAAYPFGHAGSLPVGSQGDIPDAFNPFDMPSEISRNHADPLASLLGDAGQTARTPEHQGIQAAPSIDSLFQSAPSSGSDPALFGLAPRGSADGTLDSLIGNNSNSDPLSLFDAAAAEPASPARAMRNDSHEMGSAFQPPLPVQTIPAMQSPQASYIPSSASDLAGFAPTSVPIASSAAPFPFNPLAAPPGVSAVAPQMRPASFPPAPSSFEPDVLTQAFLRGAGLTPSSLPSGLTPEIMTTIGSLLRSATAGAIDMLAARAATKREVQATVTIISVQANNPLKFLPNADSALLQLLGKKMPGFMRADVAMKDAFEDLRAHEVGVIAGTRAALTEVLGKFDPAVLGDKLTKGSVLESLMPSARKAKLWDMYLERYLQIRREAEDDFQSIFGRAFVQAYELETARIKGDTSGSGGD